MTSCLKNERKKAISLLRTGSTHLGTAGSTARSLIGMICDMTDVCENETSESGTYAQGKKRPTRTLIRAWVLPIQFFWALATRLPTQLVTKQKPAMMQMGGIMAKDA